jgi:hypothetical protein
MAMVAEHPNELVRDQYVMQIADRCRLEPSRLREISQKDRTRHDGRSRAPAVRAADDPGVSSQPTPVAVSGPELEALRLAVHHPESVADRLELALFAHPLARACFEALSAASTLHEAIEAADPQAADLLQRLAVEATEAEVDDVMCRVVERAGHRALRELEVQMRHAPPAEHAGFVPAVTWLKLSLESLRPDDPADRPAALEAEHRLVGWLVARDNSERTEAMR